MDRIIFSLIVFVVNFLVFIFLKDFKCPLKYHILSFGFAGCLVFLVMEYNINSLLFICLFELLLLASFIDIKHFEVSNRLYILVFIPCLLQFIFSSAIIENVLSVIAVYVTFWVFDKFVGIEKLGGADVKMMLILSFYFLASQVLLFVFYVFLFSAIIFVIERVVKKSSCDLQVPMISAMCLGFFIEMFPIYCFMWF